MAMGTRKKRQRQEELWYGGELPTAPGHPFYKRLDENTPDHVTISRTRRLIDAETHQRTFTWVLERLAQGGLIKGKTIGVDSTTLEANAAMKSIVRRDTGENYTAYLKRLAEAEGVDATDAAALRRMDRKRAKKTSNEDWISPSDAAAEN